jgi:predicted transcriptional regulator of viral defense system
MSTKTKKLMNDSRNLYHTQDLAVLWDIDNKNTLYTTIKRYSDKGILNKIYKGFYATKPIRKINPVRLGLSAIHRFGYLSTESVLVEAGIIFQDIKYITLVSGISKKFEVGGHNFIVRKMKDIYLFNETGIENVNGVRKALAERAIADMLYFNPNYHFDAKESINWDKVKKIQKQVYGSSE